MYMAIRITPLNARQLYPTPNDTYALNARQLYPTPNDTYALNARLAERANGYTSAVLEPAIAHMTQCKPPKESLAATGAISPVHVAATGSYPQ